jgi:membrane protein implicated in regulation of membrane protease activity
MASAKGFFTRFNFFLWCGIGFLFVALRHILMSGYNHRAGFMVLLGLALLAAAFTDRQKRKLQAWRQEQTRKSKEEKQGKTS